MIQVRQGVFETNSSSTHSICIPKKCDKIVNKVYFGLGCYGWENDSVDPASYLYTGILDAYNKDDAQELVKKLTDIMVANDIEFSFEKPKYIYGSYDGVPYLDYGSGYVDHAYDLRPFIEYILDDEDMLLRYLSAGEVYTGNDNSDPDYSGCYIADEYMWDYDTDEQEPNPYHDKEKYDYFFKGN